ncbi:hypothetical protein QL093DRAFT_1269924 [Fusarium oxysporum]|nr:hypothetical protein QL093DRAFT_1269924 [Fusarium oxysporum]
MQKTLSVPPVKSGIVVSSEPTNRPSGLPSDPVPLFAFASFIKFELNLIIFHVFFVFSLFVLYSLPLFSLLPSFLIWHFFLLWFYIMMK